MPTIRGSALALLVWAVLAVPAVAQQSIVGGTRARITDRMVVGGSTFGEVMRIVGSPVVSSGTGTINPAAIDADGDVLEDSNTTISTAGAWTWGGAGTFNSNLTLSSALPSLRLHESDQAASAKYWAWEPDGGSLYLRLYDDTPSSSNAAVRLDRSSLVPGDWRWGSLLNTIRPENNGGSNLGSLNKKYLTLHAWELWVQTLVAQNVLATIGGRIMVAPTTELTRDVASGDTVVYVKHNQARVNDTLLLQANGLFEKMLVTAGPTDCAPSGNCGVAGNDFGYNVTRNRDGTGANDWAAGSALVNEGNVGDGYIDVYSDRSATSEGYPGQVVSDGPVVYFRMAADTATTNNDVMGSGLVATEGGTQSAGLGVAATGWSSVADPIWENLGAAGYLSVPDAALLDITADLTIEFFAGWQRTTARTEFIVSKHWTAEYHVEVASNGTLRFCHGTSVGPTFTCVDSASGYVPNDTIIHHYAIVRDSISSPKRILFYKDGALTNTFTYTQSVTTSTNNLVIGSNPTSLSGNEFDGYIDEVAIYNYQVPADRIALHYASALNGSISKFTIGPTLCGNVRTGTAAFDLAERWCLGNLAGTYGYNSVASVYGFASGNPSATWVSVDATNGFRIMNGSTAKTTFDTSGNGSLTGDLSIGTSGSLRSGATAYDTGTGYYLEYNGGTPRMRIGTTSAGTNYLRYTGSALELKSSELTIGSSGIALNARTSDSFNAGHTYGFNVSNTSIGMWAFDNNAPDSVDLRLQSHTSRSLTQARINMTVLDEDSDVAGININTGTTASSDSNINFSAQTITVDVSNTGATANLSCGAGQAIKTLNVRKGIIIATPTCGAP